MKRTKKLRGFKTFEFFRFQSHLYMRLLYLPVIACPSWLRVPLKQVLVFNLQRAIGSDCTSYASCSAVFAANQARFHAAERRAESTVRRLSPCPDTFSEILRGAPGKTSTPTRTSALPYTPRTALAIRHITSVIHTLDPAKAWGPFTRKSQYLLSWWHT